MSTILEIKSIWHINLKLKFKAHKCSEIELKVKIEEQNSLNSWSKSDVASNNLLLKIFSEMLFSDLCLWLRPYRPPPHTLNHWIPPWQCWWKYWNLTWNMSGHVSNMWKLTWKCQVAQPQTLCHSNYQFGGWHHNHPPCSTLYSLTP